MLYEINSFEKVFYLNYKGEILLSKGNTLSYIHLKHPLRNLKLEEEIKKKHSMDFVKDKLLSNQKNFEEYNIIFSDPMYLVNNFGLEKSSKYLNKNGLLDIGFEQKINVASDLFINSLNSDFRLKPSSLLYLHYIESGKMDELIINVANNIKTDPFKNQI